MNILFVCGGNTCRSPMAAALMNKLAVEKDLDVRIESAGMYAYDGDRASENASGAMKDYGIDLSYHRAKPVSDDLIKNSDLILTMTEAQKNALEKAASGKVFTIMEYAGEKGDISDPYGKDLEEYKKCAEGIYNALLKIADKIKND